MSENSYIKEMICIVEFEEGVDPKDVIIGGFSFKSKSYKNGEEPLQFDFMESETFVDPNNKNKWMRRLKIFDTEYEEYENNDLRMTEEFCDNIFEIYRFYISYLVDGPCYLNKILEIKILSSDRVFDIREDVIEEFNKNLKYRDGYYSFGTN